MNAVYKNLNSVQRAELGFYVIGSRFINLSFLLSPLVELSLVGKTVLEKSVNTNKPEQSHLVFVPRQLPFFLFGPLPALSRAFQTPHSVTQ